MGANQNSSMKLGLYPKIDPTPLSSNGQDRIAIEKLSALRTGLGTAAETHNSASESTCKIDDKNRIEEQFISSQAFHRTPGGRVRETTVGEQFKPRILETFDPVTQEIYWLHPATIHTQEFYKKIEL
jgi:hypothetical protein